MNPIIEAGQGSLGHSLHPAGPDRGLGSHPADFAGGLVPAGTFGAPRGHAP